MSLKIDWGQQSQREAMLGCGSITTNTILLIHDNFVNNVSWPDWKHHYKLKRRKVYAPANPARLIDTLSEKPLIIGHSMAGMAVLPAFWYFSSKKYFMGSRRWYNCAFFNTLFSPESYKVGRQLVLSPFANIGFDKPHEPILFIGGGNDHIFPANQTRSIAGRYKDANSMVM